MGIAMGRSGHAQVADINVTPLIDVLLVLLIVFIVTQMNLQRAFDIQLPVDSDFPPHDDRTIVLEIESHGVSVNTKRIQPAALEAYLREVYSNRPDKIIFVKAAPEVPFGEVIHYIDTARAAGVRVVGAVLPGAVGPSYPGPTI